MNQSTQQRTLKRLDQLLTGVVSPRYRAFVLKEVEQVLKNTPKVIDADNYLKKYEKEVNNQ